MKCARCGRDVADPQDIAGVKLGKKCAAIVRAAIVQPHEREQHTEPDPNQRDFFRIPDLLEGMQA